MMSVLRGKVAEAQAEWCLISKEAAAINLKNPRPSGIQFLRMVAGIGLRKEAKFRAR